MTPTGRPPASVWDGTHTVRVNGLYRHGFMLAPEVTAQAAGLVQALLGGRIADAAAFHAWRDAARWPELLVDARSAAVRGDGSVTAETFSAQTPLAATR